MKNTLKDLTDLTKRGAGRLLTRLSRFLAGQGIQSCLVGGFVRDTLLGRDVADIDIAVVSDALEVASQVADALSGKYVPLDKVNRVGRVVLLGEEAPGARKQWNLDFSTFAGDIRQDLARRDFTVDAMAVDLSQVAKSGKEVELIDPFDGWNDLQQGVIRVVAETAFASDAVRLLRAVRLAAELNFRIDTGTEELIRRYSHLVVTVAGERIREELLQMLAVSQTGQLLHYLDDLGLLTTLIPELAETKGVEQPKEHFWDVFSHSVEAVAVVDFLLRQGGWKYGSGDILAATPWSSELAQHFENEVSSGSTRRRLLKLAALFHDIAKPQTKMVEAGRVRFLGHAKEGAAITVNVLERFRFSAKEIKLVETMVRHHLRPTQMAPDGLPTRRAIYRYFRDTGEAGIDILFLSLADHLATRGAHLDLAQWQEHADVVEYILTQRFREESVVAPPKLVDGYDLINIFGMRPGSKIGALLEAVREAQAGGELSTREEALSYIREHILSECEKYV